MGDTMAASVCLGPAAGEVGRELLAAARDPERAGSAGSLTGALVAVMAQADVVTAREDLARGEVIVRIADYDARDGLDDSAIEALLAASQAHGIAYKAQDDGRFENPGQYREWVPGMSQAYTCASDGLEQAMGGREELGTAVLADVPVEQRLDRVRTALGLDRVPHPHPYDATLARIEAQDATLGRVGRTPGGGR